MIVNVSAYSKLYKCVFLLELHLYLLFYLLLYLRDLLIDSFGIITTVFFKECIGMFAGHRACFNSIFDFFLCNFIELVDFTDLFNLVIRGQSIKRDLI